MNKQEQEVHFEMVVNRMNKILISKAGDYSQDSDRLSNFKLAGSIIGLSPEMNCLSLIATKVARLGVLLKDSKVPNNESIEDTILDLANYTILLSMIRKDRENQSVVQEKKTTFRVFNI